MSAPWVRGLQVPGMGDAEDLILLRERYERALASYETIVSVLNRHIVRRTSASAEELQRLREAKEALDDARRSYLETWKRQQDRS
jgi:hypothetical protein